MSIPDQDTVLLITRAGMGQAEPELARRLIITYFQLLIQNGVRPSAICFYAEGIHLAVEGSPIWDALQALEGQGVRLILCSTCLNYYQLMEKEKLGVVGGMPDILEAQFRASKVITL